jgi:hypothetical protein
MLFNDYTGVPSLHACRARHIVLTLILGLHLIFGHTVTVLVLSTALQVCNNRHRLTVHVDAKSSMIHRPMPQTYRPDQILATVHVACKKSFAVPA